MTKDNCDFLDYLGGLETTTAPEDAKKIKATYTAVMKKAGLKRMPSGAKRFGRVLLIAAAVVACTAITAAAAGVNVGDIFRGCFTAFNPVSNYSEATGLTQDQLDVLNKTARAINQSVTSNGTTITVKAAAGDKSNAFFLMEVDAAKGKTLISRNFSDVGFGESTFHLPEFDSGKIEGGYNNAMSAIAGQSSAGKITFIDQMSSSGFDLQGREIKFTIKDITYHKHQTIAKGYWAFDFKMDYGNSATKEVKVNKIAHYSSTHKSNKNTTVQSSVRTINLAILSASVRFSGDKLLDEDHIQQRPSCIIVHYRNGKQIFLLSGNGNGDAKELTVSYTASEPIDLNSVSSVTIGDLAVPVS